jgi:transposase
MNGTTGLSFKLNDVKIIILDDILTYLVTRLPGSGMSVDVDEQQLEEYCERFNIPVGGYSRGPYLPYNYLTSLGVDAFVYEYVWNSLRGHRNLQHNDEAEIGFIGRGIEKLNRAIYTIYLDGNEYEPEEKQTVLQELEHYIEHD